MKTVTDIFGVPRDVFITQDKHGNEVVRIETIRLSKGEAKALCVHIAELIHEQEMAELGMNWHLNKLREIADRNAQLENENAELKIINRKARTLLWVCLVVSWAVYGCMLAAIFSNP